MKLSLIAILLSLICLTIAIKINYDMSLEYYTVHGKSRAFLGLRHLSRLYYVVIGVLGLIIGLFAIKKKEKTWMIAVAISLSIIAIVCTIMDLWMWMI